MTITALNSLVSLLPPGLPYVGWLAFATLGCGMTALLAPFTVLCLLMAGGVLAGYTHTFALFHSVSAGLGLVLGLLSCAGSLCGLRRHKAMPTALSMLAVFTLLVLYFNWYFSGTQLSYYDEFFWGSFAKAFQHENGFWTGLSALARDDMSQAYPPMPAVLANLFMPVGKGYSEEGIALGGMLLVLAAACPVYHYMRSRLGMLHALLLTFVCACLIRTLGAKCTSYYLTGYADYLQSALFAGLVVVAVFERRWQRALLPLLAGLPMLALCKQTGIVLCLYVMAAVVLNWLLHSLLPHALSTAAPAPPRAHGHSHGENIRWSQALASLGGMAALSLGAWAAWSRYAVTHMPQPSGGNLLNLKAALADPLLWPSLREFLWATVERPLLISPTLGWLSYVTSTLTLALAAGLLFWLARRGTLRQHLDQSLQALLLFAGLLGWFLLHWFASFMFFTEKHVLAASSYERYLGSYMAGAVTVWLMLALAAWSERPAGKKLTSGVTVGLTLALTVLCALLPWQRPASLSQSPVRTQMQAAADYLQARSPAGSLYYFIPRKGHMDEEWCLRYLLLPERKGTSLLPQALHVPGQTRIVENDFLAPPPEHLLTLMRKQGVDYLYVSNPTTLQDYATHFSGKPSAPLLVHTSGILYDAANNTLNISPDDPGVSP